MVISSISPRSVRKREKISKIVFRIIFTFDLRKQNLNFIETAIGHLLLFATYMKKEIKHQAHLFNLY
jgi:hypothetical protein